MVRRFPKHIFLTSLAITIAIFVAGLLLGWNLDNVRTSVIMEELQGNELDAESFIIEQSFWDIVANENRCDVAEARLNSLSMELSEVGDYLTNYQKKNIFKEGEYRELARRYFLLEIKTYILYYDLKENCEMKNDVILFFYGTNHALSEIQGKTLDNIVDGGNNTLDIFSINNDFEGDAAIETIKIYYNITEVPTLIINNDVKIEGYANYAQIVSHLNAQDYGYSQLQEVSTLS